MRDRDAMEKTMLRTDLLASFQDLQEDFGNVLDWARECEGEFERSRLQFMDQVSERLAEARKRLPKASPVREQVLAFIGKMDATREAWGAAVAGRNKGIAFRTTFGDSLLVFVNGKVKSGKSSLGNYMAWGATDPVDALKQQVAPAFVPVYFSQDRTEVDGGDAHGEAEARREFRVGAVEATSTIQGFRLPGLTWADSPGLHSMNGANGELALTYVEHADLILYTMKSDAPGRESDLSEISRLFGRDKTILLLLTGSDDIEEMPSADGLSLVQTVVMKSPATRAQQRDYVRGALERSCGAQAARVEILSISARYAQLHADDPVRFADSGMGELFASLRRIAREDGVRIKQRTPVANLWHFLGACHADLQPYKALVAGFAQPLEEARRRTGKHVDTAVQRAQADLQSFIDADFDRIEEERAGGGVGDSLAQFTTALNAQFVEIAERHLGDIFADIMSGFATAVETSYQSSALLQLPDFATEKVTERIPVVHSGTHGRNGLLGSVVGGTIGFFLGGPAGAALGASIGGAAGGATGDSASTSFREIQVTVGDNLQQIRMQAVRQGQRMLDARIRSGAEGLWTAIDREVQQLLEALEGEIRRFEDGLQALLRATKEKQEQT